MPWKLDNYRCARWSQTFDEVVAHVTAIGDYLHAHYIMPAIDPSSRRPLLPMEAWCEVADAPVRLDDERLTKFRSEFRAHLAQIDAQDDQAVDLHLPSWHYYELLDLIDRANARRWRPDVVPPGLEGWSNSVRELIAYRLGKAEQPLADGQLSLFAGVA